MRPTTHGGVRLRPAVFGNERRVTPAADPTYNVPG